MPITFHQYLMACAAHEEFLAQYNRLHGACIGEDARSPLERLIDATTGYQDAVAARVEVELSEFTSFVFDIWQRVPVEIPG